MPMNADTLIGIFLGAGVPMVLWAARVYWLLRKLHAMHLKPDEFGFGLSATHEILRQVAKTQEMIHRENVENSRGLKYAVRELSHYVRWDARQRTGKEPPPYVHSTGHDGSD